MWVTESCHPKVLLCLFHADLRRRKRWVFSVGIWTCSRRIMFFLGHCRARDNWHRHLPTRPAWLTRPSPLATSSVIRRQESWFLRLRWAVQLCKPHARTSRLALGEHQLRLRRPPSQLAISLWQQKKLSAVGVTTNRCQRLDLALRLSPPYLLQAKQQEMDWWDTYGKRRLRQIRPTGWDLTPSCMQRRAVLRQGEVRKRVTLRRAPCEAPSANFGASCHFTTIVPVHYQYRRQIQRTPSLPADQQRPLRESSHPARTLETEHRCWTQRQQVTWLRLLEVEDTWKAPQDQTVQCPASPWVSSQPWTLSGSLPNRLSKTFHIRHRRARPSDRFQSRSLHHSSVLAAKAQRPVTAHTLVNDAGARLSVYDSSLSRSATLRLTKSRTRSLIIARLACTTTSDQLVRLYRTVDAVISMLLIVTQTRIPLSMDMRLLCELNVFSLSEFLWLVLSFMPLSSAPARYNFYFYELWNFRDIIFGQICHFQFGHVNILTMRVS